MFAFACSVSKQVCPHAAARENMLQRFAQVTPEGEYRPPPPENAKAAYATMVYVRATIVEDAGWVLARAATIAVSDPFLSVMLLQLFDCVAALALLSCEGLVCPLAALPACC